MSNNGNISSFDDNSNSSMTLLWEPNASGWTAVHYAVSHYLPLEWLAWILSHASQHNPRQDQGSYFWSRKTALGQSVFDIFLASHWTSLPWQGAEYKERARKLSSAVHFLLRCGHEIDDERLLVWMGETYYCRAAASDNHGIEQDYCYDAFNVTMSFFERLYLLCRAAAGLALGGSVMGRGDYEWMISIIASNGCCPGPVAELLLKFAGRASTTTTITTCQNVPRRQSTTFNAQQSTAANATIATATTNHPTPLHSWAAARNHCPDSDDGMLDPLLQAYPEAIQQRDGHGRLPLQVALQSGKSWHRIQRLYVATAATGVDVSWAPVWAAMATPPHDRQAQLQARARQSKAGKMGFWLLEISPAIRQTVVQEMDCQQLETIFRLLLADPQALQLARRQEPVWTEV